MVKQNSNTRLMLFNVPALIADISSGITLEPGDVIATGSPSGVGAGGHHPSSLRQATSSTSISSTSARLSNPVVDATPR